MHTTECLGYNADYGSILQTKQRPRFEHLKLAGGFCFNQSNVVHDCLYRAELLDGHLGANCNVWHFDWLISCFIVGFDPASFRTFGATVIV